MWKNKQLTVPDSDKDFLCTKYIGPRKSNSIYNEANKRVVLRRTFSWATTITSKTYFIFQEKKWLPLNIFSHENPRYTFMNEWRVFIFSLIKVGGKQVDAYNSFLGDNKKVQWITLKQGWATRMTHDMHYCTSQ